MKPLQEVLPYNHQDKTNTFSEKDRSRHLNSENPSKTTTTEETENQTKLKRIKKETKTETPDNTVKRRRTLQNQSTSSKIDTTRSSETSFSPPSGSKQSSSSKNTDNKPDNTFTPVIVTNYSAEYDTIISDYNIDSNKSYLNSLVNKTPENPVEICPTLQKTSIDSKTNTTGSYDTSFSRASGSKQSSSPDNTENKPDIFTSVSVPNYSAECDKPIFDYYIDSNKAYLNNLINKKGFLDTDDEEERKNPVDARNLPHVKAASFIRATDASKEETSTSIAASEFDIEHGLSPESAEKKEAAQILCKLSKQISKNLFVGKPRSGLNAEEFEIAEVLCQLKYAQKQLANIRDPESMSRKSFSVGTDDNQNNSELENSKKPLQRSPPVEQATTSTKSTSSSLLYNLTKSSKKGIKFKKSSTKVKRTTLSDTDNLKIAELSRKLETTTLSLDKSTENERSSSQNQVDKLPKLKEAFVYDKTKVQKKYPDLILLSEHLKKSEPTKEAPSSEDKLQIPLERPAEENTSKASDKSTTQKNGDNISETWSSKINYIEDKIEKPTENEDTSGIQKNAESKKEIGYKIEPMKDSLRTAAVLHAFAKEILTPNNNQDDSTINLNVTNGQTETGVLVKENTYFVINHASLVDLEEPIDCTTFPIDDWYVEFATATKIAIVKATSHKPAIARTRTATETNAINPTDLPEDLSPIRTTISLHGKTAHCVGRPVNQTSHPSSSNQTNGCQNANPTNQKELISHEKCVESICHSIAMVFVEQIVFETTQKVYLKYFSPAIVDHLMTTCKILSLEKIKFFCTAAYQYLSSIDGIKDFDFKLFVSLLKNKLECFNLIVGEVHVREVFIVVFRMVKDDCTSEFMGCLRRNLLETQEIQGYAQDTTGTESGDREGNQNFKRCFKTLVWMDFSEIERSLAIVSPSLGIVLPSLDTRRIILVSMEISNLELRVY